MVQALDSGASPWNVGVLALVGYPGTGSSLVGTAGLGQSVSSRVRDPMPQLRKAQVFVGGGKRNGSGALFEQVDRL